MSSTLDAFFELIQNGHYSEALIHAPQIEMELASLVFFHDASLTPVIPSSQLFTRVHLALLIWANELEECRYLWRRIRDKSDMELGLIWNVASKLLQGLHSEAVSILVNTNWSAPVQGVLGETTLSLQKQRILEVSTAYSSITLVQLAKYICVHDEEHVRKVCMSNGWSIEGALVKIPLSKTQAYNAPLDGELLSELTEFVSYLQRKPLSVDLSDRKNSSQTDEQAVTSSSSMVQI